MSKLKTCFLFLFSLIFINSSGQIAGFQPLTNYGEERTELFLSAIHKKNNFDENGYVSGDFMDTYNYSVTASSDCHACTTYYHKGLDVVLESGVKVPLYSPLSGEVININASLGRISIKNTDYGGLTFIFLHCSEIYVAVDDFVSKGELIGKSGEVGLPAGSGIHAHTVIRKGETNSSPCRCDSSPNAENAYDPRIVLDLFPNIEVEEEFIAVEEGFNERATFSCNLDVFNDTYFDINNVSAIENMHIFDKENNVSFLVDDATISPNSNEGFLVEFQVPNDLESNEEFYDFKFDIVTTEGKRTSKYLENFINVQSSTETTNNGVGFHDVDNEHVFIEYINLCSSKEIIRGDCDSDDCPQNKCCFFPDSSIQRREAVIMLFRYLMLNKNDDFIDVSTANGTFGDVAQGQSDPFFIAIQTFRNKGYISPNVNFFPFDYITRGEFAKIYVNALEITNPNVPLTSDFDDVMFSHIFYNEIKVLKDLGIVDGYDDNGEINFEPESLITRGEVSKFIANAFDSEIETALEQRIYGQSEKRILIGHDFEYLSFDATSSIQQELNQSDVYLSYGESIGISYDFNYPNYHYYWKIRGYSNTIPAVTHSPEYENITFTAPNESCTFRLVSYVANKFGKAYRKKINIFVEPQEIDNCSKFAFYEPNDTPTTADTEAFPYLDATISTSRSLHGILHEGDVDIYNVTLGHTGVLDIDLSNLPDNYDLFVLDGNGNTFLSSINSGRSDENIVLTKNGNSQENFFIKVAGASANDFDCDDTYKLAWNWTPTASGDEFDPPIGLYVRHSAPNNVRVFWQGQDYCQVSIQGITDPSYTSSTTAQSGDWIKSLNSNEIFTVKIKKSSPIFSSIWSEPVQFETFHSNDMVKSPEDVSATGGTSNSSITIEWTPAHSDSDYHRIWRGVTNDPDNATPITGWIVNSSPNTFDDIDSSLEGHKEYWYFVQPAADASGSRAGRLGWGDSGMKRLSPTNNPPESSDDGFFDKIVINIEPVPGASHYRVYRNTSNSPNSSTPISDWQTSLIYIDEDIEAGIEYYYWIKNATSETGANQTSYGVEVAANSLIRGITGSTSIINIGSISTGEEQVDIVNPLDNGIVISYTTSDDNLIVVADYFNHYATQTSNGHTVSNISFVLHAPELQGNIDLIFYLSEEDVQRLLDADSTITSVNDIEILKYSGSIDDENGSISDNLDGTTEYLTPTVEPYPGGYKFILTGLTSLSEFWFVGPFNPTLPLELLNFSANQHREDFKVMTTWTTVSEQNTSLFELEHSKDGFVFTKVGEEKASGNSVGVLNYEFLHLKPNWGVNYYRLKCIDTDGSYKYSKIEQVTFRQDLDIAIHPNPTNGTLYIQTTCDEKAIALKIISIEGKIMDEFRLSECGDLELDTGKYPQGEYFVQFTAEGQIQAKKFVVVR